MLTKTSQLPIHQSVMAILITAATLFLPLCSETCGQDLSKSVQIEAPILDLIKPNGNLAELHPASNTGGKKPTAEDAKQPTEDFTPTGDLDIAFAKSSIEIPTKNILGLATTHTDSQPETPSPSAQPSQQHNSVAETPVKSNNPSVEPGRVNWHADLATATEQSKLSGKPIFHFQLLGQLDQRFT